MNLMVEFKVNDYISLRLEDNKTVIYVNNDRFNQCKYLLLNISYDDVTFLEDIESVDEAALHLDNSLEYNEKIKIPPKTEFWGHCSNLQVWAENNYDTRLLLSNLAFPLLKRLKEEGDLKAQKVLKEEVIKRFLSYELNVIQFLVEEKYLNYLNSDEIKILMDEIIYGINKMSVKKAISYFETISMACFDDRSLVKVIENLSGKLKNQSRTEVLDLLSNVLKFNSSNSNFYKLLLKNPHISKKLFSLITSREYNLQYKVINFLKKFGDLGSAYIIKWFPFGVKKFNAFNFKNVLFSLKINKFCLNPHLEMIEFLVYQIISIKEYNFENYNKLMEILEGINFLFETYLRREIVEISNENFYSKLNNYYDKCNAELIIDVSDDILQYRIQPKEQDYYYDFLQERLPINDFFRGNHDAYRELKRVLFPKKRLLIFGITGGWDEYPFSVSTGILGLSTRGKEWIEKIKLNVVDLKDKQSHRVIFKGLRKLLATDLSNEEKLIGLYYFMDYLIYEVKFIEIRYIDVRVFKKRIKDYYENQNCTVIFEGSIKYTVIFEGSIKNTVHCGNKQNYSLFKIIFFPIENISIINIIKMRDYAFCIKK